MSRVLCVFALLVLSIGCTAKDVPLSIPPANDDVEITVANKTFDINPANKVLVPSDIPDLKYHDVVISEYKTLDTLLEEGISKNEYDSLRVAGYIEGYEVEYEVKREIDSIESFDVIKNTIAKYEIKRTLFRRMDDLEEIYKSNNMIEIPTGRGFGDKVIYAKVGRGYKAHVQVENIEIYLEISKEGDDEGELSDLYPYIELLINRLKSDEEVQPPEVTV